MDRKRLWVLLIGLVFMAGCSGQTKQEPQPEPVVAAKTPEPEPEPKPLDPFEQRVETFKKTYALLACLANRDYDPRSNVGTLREPYEQIVQLQEDMSITLEGYLRILQAQGYGTVDAFKKEKEAIVTARPGFFDKLSGDLYDFIEACP